jgi:gliding motility-associated-like protein
LIRLISYFFSIFLFLAINFAFIAPGSLLPLPECDPGIPPTQIDSVSVDPITGEVNIGWTQNASPYTWYYVIYVFNPASDPPWDAVDTIYGAGNTWANIPGSDPSSGVEVYAVSAYDSCGNSSFFSLASAHNTIHLDSEYDQCNKKIKLTWNKYKNWPNGVNQYKVWLSINGGAYSLVGITAPADTTFLHSGVTSDVNYCYLVQAVERVTLKTATSNRHCRITSFPKEPEIHYLKYATVTAEDKVKLSCAVDSTADISKYIIKKRIGGVFEMIEEVISSNVPGSELIYIDEDVSPSSESYVYRIDAENTCGQLVAISNIARTILLNGDNDRLLMKNSLKWSDYEGWDGEVVAFNVYRYISGNEQLINTVPYGVNYYEDDVSDFYETPGDFCYIIEALEGPGFAYNFQEKSASNRKCITQPPLFYIPNAFNPNGIAKEFKPVFSFVDPTAYYFAIFSRWGEKFFETTNPQQGWDGTSGAGNAPTGVYGYHIEYNSASGQKFSASGTVTLLR